MKRQGIYVDVRSPQSNTRRILLSAALTVLSLAAAAVAYAEFRLRVVERLDPVLDAPGGKHLEVSGHLVHYEIAGDGPTLVLIHGFGGSTYSWRKNINPLAEAGYRVVALDQIGFGYSERSSLPVYTATAQAQLLERFLATLPSGHGQSVTQKADGGINPGYVLIGNSMGAAVALRFAADYPELTRAVIVTAPAIYFRRSWTRMLPLLRMPVLGRITARSIFFYILGNERSASKMLASAYDSRIDQVTEEMRESLLRPLRVRGSADAAHGLGLSHEARSLADDLASISAPVLVVAGGRDRAVPFTSVQRVHERLPQSQLVVLADAGHLVQEEAPDEFNRLVIQWVQALGKA